ncbi:MAG: Unknown protein [uncultured Sulfurovum sp.]|uniref:Uncharacterized protein n=1 Tax=uncultured Sulfurovum sp. TaxID=269237 RepID=A0A6S6TJS4_9BACT|nr:MAG: Unknown protein [uncultured Sulfurovum sp.]
MLGYAFEILLTRKNKMNKTLLLTITISSLVLIGCGQKNVSKEETVKELSPKNDKYAQVVQKSLKDCKEHNILLDEARTDAFMHRSPEETISKAAESKVKTSKKLCQFFADETSLKKEAKVEEFTSKIVNGCQGVGVNLSKENIHKKIKNLPFFVIRKGLAMQKETSLQECELMQKKYQ